VGWHLSIVEHTPAIAQPIAPLSRGELRFTNLFII
jgi:hypothetical protein